MHRLAPTVYAATDYEFFFTVCARHQGRPFDDRNIAKLVVDSLHWTRERYGWRLNCYCLMPDHLHFVCRIPDREQKPVNAGSRGVLPEGVLDHLARFKSYTTHQSWKFGIQGQLWQRSSYDRVFDLDWPFEQVVQYILDNPVRKGLVKDWNLNLKNLAAVKSVAEQEAQFGKMYQDNPAQCCQLRKVEPLFAGLEDYDIWFTGLRREQSPTRAKLEVFETATLKSGKQIAKVSPLAHWSWKEVWQYARENQLPILELYDQGYTSIGCEPCTALPSGENLRSGRWGGKKLECGIHTFAPSGS
jgi:phosphoadenosine phosphosulfate reductase